MRLAMRSSSDYTQSDDVIRLRVHFVFVWLSDWTGLQFVQCMEFCDTQSGHRECANEHANSADLSTVHSRTLSINHKWQANYIRFDRKTQERPTNYAQTLHLKGPGIGRDVHVMIQGYLSQVQLASHES